jgi:secreted PhoX family phosphatase
VPSVRDVFSLRREKDVVPDRSPARRKLLPFLGDGHSGGARSAQTCLYRCGNACFHAVPNTTDNPYLGDVIASVSRRSVLKGMGAAALVVGAGGSLAPRAAAAATTGAPSAVLDALPGSELTFQPVPPNRIDDITVPGGYRYKVVMRWGDPVESGAPKIDPYRQTAAKQAGQFGYNCDYVSVLPLDESGDSVDGVDTALLVVNHEYTDEQLMFPGCTGAADTDDEQKRIAMMAHGMSVVEISRVGNSGAWAPGARRSRYNRRITTATPLLLTGPAAGSEYVRTNADPSGTVALGTLNNCAGGTTPWGTILSGEENFNQYFGASTPVADSPERRLGRYGINGSRLSEREWEKIDARFDLSKEPNEPNRFGWIVELDPFDKSSMPRKRTALGRFKHEGATVVIAEDGRAVAYSGDDERFDYIYKFVSHGTFDPAGTAEARRHNMTLLDEGDLYVGRFDGDSPAGEITGTGALPSDGEFDGTGEWIPLVRGGESMIPGKSVAWVLTFTRLAADRLGKKLDPATGDYVDVAGNPLPANGTPVVVDASKLPTKMDRPEDVEPNPVNGRVYAALTNNSNRTSGPDEANPLTQSLVAGASGLQRAGGNRNGHVIEWEETAGRSGTTFAWRIFLIAGDPQAPETYFAGYDKASVSPISCPDNLAFDPAGNLWISTDGNVLGSNDGLFAVPVEGSERGHLRQFLTVPFGAETCGPFITGDARSCFVAVQHPGETTGSTFDAPSSRWPGLDEDSYPRPSVAVAYRIHGDRRIGV